MAELELNLDYERMPLKQRLKFLLASRSELEKIQLPPAPNTDYCGIVKENELCHSHQLSGCCPQEKMFDTVLREKIHAGGAVECENQETLAHKCTTQPSLTNTAAAIASEALHSVESSSLQQLLFLEHPKTLKVEHINDVENPTNFLCGSSGAGIQSVHFEPEMSVEYLDKLDHVVLKERRRSLLLSKSLGLMATIEQENSSETALSASAMTPQAAGKEKGELSFGDRRLSMLENQIHDNDVTLESNSSKCNVNPWGKSLYASGHCSEGKKSYSSGGYLTGNINDKKSFSEINCSKYEENGKKFLVSTKPREAEYVAIPNLTYIKVEPPNYSEFQSSDATTLGQMSFLDPIKTEDEISGDLYEDKVDHLLLRERMKLLSSRNDVSFNFSNSSHHTSQTYPSSFACKPVAPISTQPLKINRSRKRRKTATDSVETAMEEDAPGLLQVLVEKGVSVNEIKLYGEPESNDALDDSTFEDGFSELEEVITKLFCRSEPLLKFGPLRCSKGEKASYCLECLLSLVEQARYLQFRNWPVEWGWCRELQSFIFVFEKHNRIVLERPEYGFATYFFELAHYLPISWQIKRLVVAMKVTNCSRTTLLENRSLTVGDDLTKGEAKVMMEYGWIPNTGLGTLLNYYDRVVHDRKNEKDISEWRSKIGKLLVDGYNGGIIVSSDIPSKITEYDAGNSQQIKLELN